MMTDADSRGRTAIPDSVGQASYTTDSHNCQRYVATDVEMQGARHVAVIGSNGL